MSAAPDIFDGLYADLAPACPEGWERSARPGTFTRPRPASHGGGAYVIEELVHGRWIVRPRIGGTFCWFASGAMQLGPYDSPAIAANACGVYEALGEDEAAVLPLEPFRPVQMGEPRPLVVRIAEEGRR